MRNKKIIFFSLLGIAFMAALLLIIISINNQHHSTTSPDKNNKSSKIKTAMASVTKNETQKPVGTEKIKKKPKEIVNHATLAAVGDILIHDRVYKPAKTKNGYDFKPNLKSVRPLIRNTDLAVANSESIIGGEDIGLSTYPSFNSPYEVGDALKDTGINVVTMANNHTLDRGIQAITNAIHYWDKIGMVHTGSALSQEEQQKITTVSKNHITFSFLAYTYGTNGIPTPAGKDYLVNRINLPQMKKDIARAKKLSDVVVVSLHFGIEYERMPNASQKKLVKQLADLGVDIILGSHPHVLQPVQWVQGQDGHKTFVAYSLGNFFTGQNGEIHQEIGGILKLNIVKHTNGSKTSITITQPQFTLTWVNVNGYKLFLLKNAKGHGLDQAPQLETEMKEHMKQWMPELNVS